MCPTALALAAALALPAVPLTPAPPPGLPPTYAGLTLWLNKSVQDELKLTAEQVAVVEKSTAELTEKFRADLRVPDPESRMKAVFVFRADAVKALKAVLRPEQAARLGQIEIQTGGMQALTREDVLQELKLTDRQKELLREEYTRFQDEARKLFAELTEEGQARARERTQILQRKTVEEFIGTLNDEQRRRWKELTGPAFELKR